MFHANQSKTGILIASYSGRFCYSYVLVLLIHLFYLRISLKCCSEAPSSTCIGLPIEFLANRHVYSHIARSVRKWDNPNQIQVLKSGNRTRLHCSATWMSTCIFWDLNKKLSHQSRNTDLEELVSMLLFEMIALFEDIGTFLQESLHILTLTQWQRHRPGTGSPTLCLLLIIIIVTCVKSKDARLFWYPINNDFQSMRPCWEINNSLIFI